MHGELLPQIDDGVVGQAGERHGDQSLGVQQVGGHDGAAQVAVPQQVAPFAVQSDQPAAGRRREMDQVWGSGFFFR